MEYIVVVKFRKHQHYKKYDSINNMIWFKWYLNCLIDHKFSMMDDGHKWLFIGLICLACKTNNLIPYDLDWITKQISSNGKDSVDKAIKLFKEKGMVFIDSIDGVNTFKELQEGKTYMPSENLPAKQKDGGYTIRSDKQRIVVAYKLLKGFKFDDRQWDKIHFARCMKSVNKIVEIFDNNWEKIRACLKELSAEFEKAGLNWTLETIVNHSLEWKMKQEKKEN